MALTLWRVQRERTLASIKNIKAGLPSPRLAIHDPWALRALVVVLLLATAIAAGEDRRARVAAAFDWQGVHRRRQCAARRLGRAAALHQPAADHPLGRRSTIRTRRQRRTTARCRCRRAARSSSAPAADASTSSPAAGFPRPPQATSRRRSAPKSAATRSPPTASRRCAARPGCRNGGLPRLPDEAPSISLAKDPERQARGSLLMSYKLEDDYGVTEAHATFTARKTDAQAHGRCSRRRISRWCCRTRARATASARR